MMRTEADQGSARASSPWNHSPEQVQRYPLRPRTLASIHRRLVVAPPVDLEFSLYCAAVDVASEAFAATFLCDPFPPAFFAAFAGALFTAVFLPAVFLVAVCATFAASARF